jgi:hypothetical protein
MPCGNASGFLGLSVEIKKAVAQKSTGPAVKRGRLVLYLRVRT